MENIKFMVFISIYKFKFRCGRLPPMVRIPMIVLRIINSNVKFTIKLNFFLKALVF